MLLLRSGYMTRTLRRIGLLLGLGATSAALSASAAQATDAIKWRGWTDSLFADAKRENRLVILDLEAVWCHWCHVMDETTYADAEVAALVAKPPRCPCVTT